MRAEDDPGVKGFSPILRVSAGPTTADAFAQRRLPHVLLVVDGFPKTLGGGERVVLRLAEQLPRYGYRASILTFALNPASEFQLSAAPCPVYLLPLRNTYNLTAWRGALVFRRLLRQQQIRIVQTFFESSDLWAGVVTRLLSPAKLIWSRRDMGILRRQKHGAAYRTLRRLPHAVFAVSEQVRQHAIEVDRISPARVHTIHNGLELGALPPLRPRLNPRAATVTTVGNIRRVKGHDVLIRAAAVVIAKFPLTTFTVAGEILEPEYFAGLRKLVSDLGLNDRFLFLGRLSDLTAHLKTADIFVLPSRSEGFSNALIEAMAAGLPSIATEVGGNAEAIHDRISGLLVPSEDVSALSAAILHLLASPELAEQLGCAGQQAVKASFSADAMLSRTTAMYDRLLSPP